MASSPLLRKSHSDRCAKRDPRARRVRRMINRADMQIFRQTVPPLRRLRSDRCARRDPRARRGAPMNRRADMRVFRQTVPPLRRSQSDRCAQRDPRAHAGDKRPSRAAMRLPPFKGAAWGWTQGGHHSRAQARQGGGAGRRAARARTRASHPQQSGWGGGMRARVPHKHRSERRFRLPSGSERLRVGAFSGVPAALRRRARVSSPASERCGRRATPSSPCA